MNHKKKKTIGIYKITSPSGRIYIGQSIWIERRWSQYRNGDGAKYSTKLKNSFSKYGVVRHAFEVIEECDVNILDERELYWGQYYNSITVGLNLTLGKAPRGVLNPFYGKKHSDATRAKMSQIKKDRPISPELRAKLIAGRKGKPAWNSGMDRGEAFREKCRLSKLGTKMSDEAKRNMSVASPCHKAVRQYTRTGEFIKEWMNITTASQAINTCPSNISRSCILKGNNVSGGFVWRYSSDPNQDVGHEIIDPTAKPITQYDLLGTKIKDWQSIKFACEQLGACRSSVGDCCKGKIKKSGGFIWKYKNQELITAQ